MNLIQMEPMCCLVMFGWPAVHSTREKRVVSCNVAAPPKLFLQAQKTYVQRKNCMNMKVPQGRTYRANFLANELNILIYILINAFFLIHQITVLFLFFVFKDMLPGLYRTRAVPSDEPKTQRESPGRGLQVECCEVCNFFLES